MLNQKKTSSKRTQSLPGAKLLDHFKTAKKQTQDLLSKSKKKLASAKAGEQGHAKKYKLAQETLKKRESSHKTKPSKSSSKNVASAKAKLKQVQGLHAKAQDVHIKAKDHHSFHQNHYDKLNHLHNAVLNAEKTWTPPRKG